MRRVSLAKQIYNMTKNDLLIYEVIDEQFAIVSDTKFILKVGIPVLRELLALLMATPEEKGIFECGRMEHRSFPTIKEFFLECDTRKGAILTDTYLESIVYNRIVTGRMVRFFDAGSRFAACSKAYLDLFEYGDAYQEADGEPVKFFSEGKLVAAIMPVVNVSNNTLKELLRKRTG